MIIVGDSCTDLMSAKIVIDADTIISREEYEHADCWYECNWLSTGVTFWIFMPIPEQYCSSIVLDGRLRCVPSCFFNGTYPGVSYDIHYNKSTNNKRYHVICTVKYRNRGTDDTVNKRLLKVRFLDDRPTVSDREGYSIRLVFSIELLSRQTVRDTVKRLKKRLAYDCTEVRSITTSRLIENTSGIYTTLTVRESGYHIYDYLALLVDVIYLTVSTM